MKHKLVKALKKIVALTEQETVDFIQDNKGKLTQEKLQQFVELKNLDSEGVNELMYDLDKQGLRGFQKPTPSTGPKDNKTFMIQEFLKAFPKAKSNSFDEYQFRDGYKASIEWLRDNGWALTTKPNSYEVFDVDDSKWDKTGLKISKDLYDVIAWPNMEGPIDSSNSINLYILVQFDVSIDKKAFLNVLPEVKRDVQIMEHKIGILLSRSTLKKLSTVP